MFPVRLPPLRERKEDLASLVPHLLHFAARKMGLAVPEVQTEHINALADYDWPGNIRELQNELERALILSQNGSLILAPPDRHHALPDSSDPVPEPALLREEDWERLQRENMRRALARSDGRVDGPGGAAELLGLRPTTLRSRMQRHGL